MNLKQSGDVDSLESSGLSGRLLLLGASGFVGSHLREAFVRITDLYTEFTSSRGVGRPSEVWSSWRVPEALLIQGQFDYIVHAATPASADLNVRSPMEMFRLNVSAMEAVIRFCEEQPTPPVVLFTSSGGVYGELPQGLASFEEGTTFSVSPQSPSAAYAEGKRVAELLLADADRRGVLRAVVARLFAFSGRYLPLDRHFAIGNFVRDAVSSDCIVVNGDGRSVRSYMDGSDMANWLLRALEVGNSDFVYHVGSEVPISIADLADLVARRAEVVLGRRPAVKVLGQASATDGVNRYVPSTSQTRALLGVEQTVTLQDSVDVMLLSASVDQQN